MTAEPGLILYDYWRSTAAYRVRIALHLKGLPFEQRPVHLVRDGGEQHSAAYREVNPQRLVPALVDGDLVLSQSLAICEYLDERYPGHTLVSGDAAQKAAIRALSQVIACDVHPLNNLRVQQYLRRELSVSDGQAVDWMHHWMALGFEAIERILESHGPAGACCFGDQPTLADVVLIPQLYNADRFDCDLRPYRRINQVADHCRGLSAFRAAAPENQPDAPGS
ncbi:MAG: maleylacetoacetate isomerase [Xanthomonadales bacterium]|nr:maleylacetoacetate isomerase [Gammaproteobacteria bacterium]NNE04744.1 maleylacetoacetate isomerase [Xanthomonadales bacterium]NNL96019.1 maleylacetoacetate isomerase [Xanthomonadales bacterium]